jgi:predicted nucleic acid-binding protein
MYLLDINILIALADPDHEHHGKAESFFLANHQRGWATCPITENGFVRIISHPSYPNGPGSTDAACTILKQLCAYARSFLLGTWGSTSTRAYGWY